MTVLLCGDGCYTGEVVATTDGWFACLACGFLYTSTEAARLPRQAGPNALDRLLSGLRDGDQSAAVARLKPGYLLPFRVEPEEQQEQEQESSGYTCQRCGRPISGYSPSGNHICVNCYKFQFDMV